jgi:peptide/histidine transporter 3/4
MDLGKCKYGGPFTTKQVEDVKAFLGIFKVLICIVPVFMLQTAARSTLPTFAQHSNIFLERHNKTKNIYSYVNGAGLGAISRHIFINSGLLPPLLVSTCIPLYLCLIRPCISYRIPGMLKRISIGIILTVLSLAISFAMDMVVHMKNTKDVKCMFSGFTHTSIEDGYRIHNSSDNNASLPLYQNIYFFMPQHFLIAASNMVIDIAVLEFICSQSPYSMKGLVLGFFFSMKSIAQAVAVSSIFPFGLAWHFKTLSCGSGFYLMNIVAGVLVLALFTCVAKRYKQRTIDEPSNEYRYAEEYYSNIQ